MFCRQNVWEKRAHSRAVCALMDGWIHTCMHAENIFYPENTHTDNACLCHSVVRTQRGRQAGGRSWGEILKSQIIYIFTTEGHYR